MLDNPILVGLVAALWGVGLVATLVGVANVIWDISLRDYPLLYDLVLILATASALVSAIAVASFVGMDIRKPAFFADDSTVLHFAAYLNVIMYCIIFFSSAGKSAAFVAAGISDFLRNNTPLQQAIASETAGEYTAAASLYLKHLAANRADTEAIRRYAICLTHLGRFNEAIGLLEKVASLDKGLKSLSASVEIVFILEARLANEKAAAKLVERLRDTYVGTPLETELEARLKSARRRGHAPC